VTYHTNGYLPPSQPTMMVVRRLLNGRRIQGVGIVEQPGTLGIQVEVGPGEDAEAIAEATSRLRTERLDLDVDTVSRPAIRRREPDCGGSWGRSSAL
jgi:hypothetical protein